MLMPSFMTYRKANINNTDNFTTQSSLSLHFYPANLHHTRQPLAPLIMYKCSTSPFKYIPPSAHMAHQSRLSSSPVTACTAH